MGRRLDQARAISETLWWLTARLKSDRRRELLCHKAAAEGVGETSVDGFVVISLEHSFQKSQVNVIDFVCLMQDFE